MYTVPQIKKVLLKEELVTATEFDGYLKESEARGDNILDFMVAKGVIPEDALYQSLAQSIGRPYINLKDRNIMQDVLFLIPEPICQTHEVIAFERSNDGVVKIAAVDPDDIQTFEFIEKKSGCPVEVHLTSPGQIRQAARLYHKNLEMEFKDLSLSGRGDLSAGADGQKLEKLASDLPVVRLVNSLLEYAIFEGASDIHLEPQEKELVVRYRIDGILRQVMTLPKSVLAGIVARIKILSNLKLDEHRLPQDGRFKIENTNYKISFRVSTIPVFDGEKIVMRLLDENNKLLQLPDLGFRPGDLKKIQVAVSKPYGMILVTGPTGSGKTTTLYAVLNTLNTPEVNISTVEDPIEYRMEHINQSQINPKIEFTFASGLRALLRQDPDIIMVGEIRDRETAEIAINAAMTGHQVLSTLHTNDAPSTLPRLLDMGVVPFLIASTVNVVVGQRLVRKICQHCIMSYQLDKQAVADLSDQLDINNFIKVMQDEGAVKGSKDLHSLLFFKGKGCKKCGDSGYKGRLGIYEVMEVTPEIQKLIITKATSAELRLVAREQKMTTMLEDGLVKAKSGVTTIEEILRVSKD